MPKTRTFDLCIIGAGSGGLSVASGAAQLGLSTALVERAEMGGDCLNTGCVPSKALLAAAKQAHHHRETHIKGIKAHEPEIDFAAVKDHVFETIQTIAPHDSQERFEGLGVKVIQETASFIDEQTVQAGEHKIRAKHFIIATGSRAAIPPINGLDKDKAYTNENIFELREKPDHLLIIGGGPIGIEMAQAHSRLGCKVTLFDIAEIMPHDDQKNVNILRDCLTNEGINIHENTNIENIEHTDKGINLTYKKDDQTQTINGTHILIAAGRTPNIESLNLNKANVAFTKKSITVNKHLRTSNKKIFAIGDVAGGPQFTHVAGYHAGLIIRQICFKILWAKTDYTALPWVTYTDPELAQVGLTEEKAREKFGENIQSNEWHFDENDRATAERKTTGRINVVTDTKGKILGASIIGPHAGELISLWTLAISSDQKLSAITNMIAPYPTYTEVSKRAASAHYNPKLFSDKTRKIVQWLQKLPF